jgi:hypothetical protein
VAAGDLREIADVEPGAGNNRAAGTATASSFLNSDAPLEGSGRRGGQRPRDGLLVQAGCCPASRRYRPACHASRARSICAGVEPGIRRGAAERAQVEVRPGQPPPALSATAGQHSRDREFPGPAGPGQFSGVAGDAARHRGGPGQAGGDVSGAWPVAAGAQVHRRRIPAGVEPGEPARGLPQSAHLVTETVRDQVPPV